MDELFRIGYVDSQGAFVQAIIEDSFIDDFCAWESAAEKFIAYNDDLFIWVNNRSGKRSGSLYFNGGCVMSYDDIPSLNFADALLTFCADFLDNICALTERAGVRAHCDLARDTLAEFDRTMIDDLCSRVFCAGCDMSKAYDQFVDFYHKCCPVAFVGRRVAYGDDDFEEISDCVKEYCAIYALRHDRGIFDLLGGYNLDFLDRKSVRFAHIFYGNEPCRQAAKDCRKEAA